MTPLKLTERPLVVTQEYIWIDGTEPIPQMRSKTKVVSYLQGGDEPKPWTFDGSSTNQATGRKSDLILNPVRQFIDPIRPMGSLVLCEVLNEDGTPHKSNTRRALEELSAKFADQQSWVGFEQEYVLFSLHDRPLGWPVAKNDLTGVVTFGEPPPQGPYYCAVGGGLVAGREIVEEHLRACIDCGINITGINAEVMLGQWEFQVGPVANVGDPLIIADHLWVARWLLNRIAEKHGAHVSLDCKPVKGDWNGSGGHFNFSTAAMRGTGGMAHIHSAISRLSECHDEHIAVYGYGLAERLTGKHETCDINTFRYGVGDRGASVRIPLHVALDGCGYFEDRRPGANMDPYRVCERMLRTVFL